MPVNVANFVIQQSVRPETDSEMLRSMQEHSQQNAVLGPVPIGPVERDAPVVNYLLATVKNHEPGGVMYVLYAGPSTGKTRAARFFCKEVLRKNHRRSILVTGTGSGFQSSYFQTIAANLEVDFTSNWARCLIAAMQRRPGENVTPFLFLDEFNSANEVDLRDIDLFMRQCHGLKFYLIVMTSKEEVANKLVELNAWQKVVPLQSVHQGSNRNIPDTPEYEVNKVPKWLTTTWSIAQLRKVINIHHSRLLQREPGLFDDYQFLIEGMTPTEALFAAEKYMLGKKEPELDLSGIDNLVD